MFINPFSPIFGGQPSFFFGRSDILARFDLAMRDRGSEDRALFVTGTRGSGKTALLEQLSQRASASGKRTIDLGPERTLNALLRSLVRHDQETKTIDPQASISILGTGASLRAGSSSKTTHPSADDLVIVLPEVAAKETGGLFVSIDEVQKVPIDDLSTISNAFQMASRKGCDVMLAVAGLPYAHEDVIHHEGCTFLRRAAHEELGLFDRSETEEAFGEAFAHIKGLSASAEALNLLNEASYGHPYLMQLLGYCLVQDVNERVEAKAYEVTGDDADGIVPIAYAAYERRALRPLCDEMTSQELAYLRAMNEVLDERRVVRTSSVAKVLGKSPASLSRVRESLLRAGIVATPGRGEVMFNIPLLGNYLEKEPSKDRNVRIALERRV